MKTRLSLLLVGSLLATLSACGPKETDPSTDTQAKLDFIVWPENNSKVFANTPIYVGNPGEEQKIEGSLAVIIGGDAPKAGDAMPDNAIQLNKGVTYGDVELPTGKQTVHVHHFGADGKATDQGATVNYEVVATPADRGVMWVAPADGAKVKSPFTVTFGVQGVGMSPAGENGLDKTVGHHHITINKGPITPGLVLPMGMDDIRHYGKAQTTAELELAPGEYELTMQFADAGHRSYGKALSSTIKITVE